MRNSDKALDMFPPKLVFVTHMTTGLQKRQWQFAKRAPFLIYLHTHDLSRLSDKISSCVLFWMASLRMSKSLRPYERGKPFDMNLRHLIVTDLLEHQSVSDIAKKYRADQSVVHKLVKKVIQTGSIEPMLGNPGRPSQLDPNVIFIDHLIKWKPSTT